MKKLDVICQSVLSYEGQYCIAVGNYLQKATDNYKENNTTGEFVTCRFQTD